MPVLTDMAGETIGPIAHEVDERWTMAYAASLGDTHDCYFDTLADDGVVAHPMFAVCPEWPVIVSGRDVSDRWGISPDEVRRSVHATHDLTVHRLVRPGDRLTTSLTYTGVEQRKPGTFQTMRMDTVDADGKPVATTYQGGMYLNVETVGGDRPDADAPAEPDFGPLPDESMAEIPVPVAHGAAHTYAECARIWNPIHTDAAVARKAGLPGIILHGTATLALGVSAVVDAVADGDPNCVRRIVCRFRAMVLMPSTITVRVWDEFPVTDFGSATSAVRFDVLNQEGGPAVDRGVILLG
ncbi:MaoC/PaaZ C-terminal domain-containing protein [Candidatus Poriferisodalis sp.]|uniref:MaoC/PaaZ C-terminal domain-containing protein n=1 Tax=Candidatus Poriferisodalis sp. TaxID=3101277 RepID=UPI003B0130E0